MAIVKPAVVLLISIWTAITDMKTDFAADKNPRLMIVLMIALKERTIKYNFALTGYIGDSGLGMSVELNTFLCWNVQDYGLDRMTRTTLNTWFIELSLE